ncbi:MAG: BsuPI-related putative proteinase inhibitor [Candidatus Bathyarchaeia archaeon]
MSARRLALVLLTLIVASGVVYFLFLNPPGPMEVTLGALISDPGRYDGKEVRVEGSLRKTWLLSRLIHNLSDGPAGVAVISPAEMDLDAYVGLKILVEGRVQYRSQVLDAPRLLLEASSVKVKGGSPRFFLQWERSGGLEGLHRTVMMDNNSTVFLLSRGETVWQGGLSEGQLQKLMQLLDENGFFSVQGDRYEARQAAADYSTFSLKVFRVSGSRNESKAVTWVDEWAAEEALPQSLTRLQRELEGFLAALSPAPYGGTVLEVSVDASTIIVGEYVTVTVKVTNVAGVNQTYDVSPPAFDILLFDVNGTLKARWSEGQAFPQVLVYRTLAPGESYEEELLWNLYRFENATWSFKPPSPGTYYLQGVLRGAPQLQAVRVRVEVKPLPQ